MMSEWEGSDEFDLLLILYFSPPPESLTAVASCKVAPQIVNINTQLNLIITKVYCLNKINV